MKLLLVSLLLGIVLQLGCQASPEVRKQRAVKRANELVAAKDFRRAVLEWKTALDVAPQDAEIHFQLGSTHLSLDDVRSAVQSFQRAVQLDPKHAAAQIKLAELYSAASDPETLQDAQSRMETLLETTPDNPEALSTLAHAELRLGEFADAEKHLTQAAAQAPSNIKAALGLAQLHVGRKHYAEAEAALKKATAQDPPLATPHVILGEFYVQLDRIDEARRQFERALAIDPNHSLALVDLAHLRRRLGDNAGAEDTYKRLAANGDAQYKTVYGVFLLKTGQHERGLAELKRVYSSEPDSRDIRRQLIAAYTITGRSADLDTLLSDALKKNARDTDALLHRARLELANGRYTDAQNSANQVLKVEPNSAVAHFVLAGVHGRLGNLRNRRQELSEAVRLNPLYLAARLELARTMIASKAASSALTLLNETPELQRRDPAVIAERNRALWATGNYGDAKKGIQAGLSLVRTPELLLQNAALSISEKNFTAARAAAEEVLKTSPEETRALDLLGRVAREEKRPETILRRVRDHASAHPKSARLQHYLGAQLARAGSLDEARATFESARRLDTSFWPATLSLAETALKQGRPDEAKTLANSLQGTRVAQAPAERLLAAIELQQNNGAAAVPHLRRVAELQPDDALAINNLAYALAEHGNSLDEALQIAQKAKELAPNHAAVDDTLGWILYKKGLYSRAIQYLEISTRRQPTAGRHAHLAMAYARTGDKNRGFLHLTTAARLNPAAREVTEAQAVIAASR